MHDHDAHWRAVMQAYTFQKVCYTAKDIGHVILAAQGVPIAIAFERLVNANFRCQVHTYDLEYTPLRHAATRQFRRRLLAPCVYI